MEEILVWALEKLESEIEAAVLSKIKEALFGKSTSLENIEALLSGLNLTLNGLPEEVTKRIQDEEYLATISRAKHNIDKDNIKELLDFLTDGQEKSYWDIANHLAIDMTGISIQEMEEKKDNPTSIDFKKPPLSSYLLKANTDKLSKIGLMTDYVACVTQYIVSLSAAVVALQHTATLALKKIEEVHEGEPFYDNCQKIIKSQATKMYLPYSGQNAGVGFANILAPALRHAPRAVIGLDLAAVFEGASQKNGSNWVAMSSFRYRDLSHRYLQWDGDMNPWTSNSGDKNWYFKFSDNTLNYLNIINYHAGKNDLYLQISTPAGFDDISLYGVWAMDEKGSWGKSELDWYWFVMHNGSTTVHIFRNGSDKSIMKNVLSTHSTPWRNSICPGASIDDTDSQWVLEVTGF